MGGTPHRMNEIRGKLLKCLIFRVNVWSLTMHWKRWILFLTCLLDFSFSALLNTLVGCDWIVRFSTWSLDGGQQHYSLVYASGIEGVGGCCSLFPSLCWPASAPPGFPHKHHPSPGAHTVGSYWKYSKVFSPLSVEIPRRTENSGQVVTDLQNRIILHSVVLLSKASWVFFSFRNNFLKSMLWTQTFVFILPYMWTVSSNFQTIY